MQSEVKGVLVYSRVQNAEKRTNQITGEVTEIREGGFIYLMVMENGLPLIKEVKCTIVAAKAMEADGKKFLSLIKDTVEDYPLDNREYKLDNGRQGFTLTLVEEGVQRRQRGSFSFDDDVFEDAKTVPPARPAVNGNGQSPALAGAR